jgi:hypothetical protein
MLRELNWFLMRWLFSSSRLGDESHQEEEEKERDKKGRKNNHDSVFLEMRKRPFLTLFYIRLQRIEKDGLGKPFFGV